MVSNFQLKKVKFKLAIIILHYALEDNGLFVLIMLKMDLIYNYLKMKKLFCNIIWN